MRACILTEYFYPDATGGTPAMLSRLARFLRDAYGEALDLTVVTSGNLYRGEPVVLPACEEWEGVRIHRLRAPRSNRRSTALRLLAGAVFSARALAHLARLPRPDVLFVGTNPPTAPIAALGLKRLRRIPYVYLIHDLYPDLAIALGMLPRQGLAARA